ncbi:uncharacterized protein LOC144139582 isoform X2 [Haemaphysalis longicornis]
MFLMLVSSCWPSPVPLYRDSLLLSRGSMACCFTLTTHSALSLTKSGIAFPCLLLYTCYWGAARMTTIASIDLPVELLQSCDQMRVSVVGQNIIVRHLFFQLEVGKLTRREVLVSEQEVEAVRQQRGHLWKFRSLGDEEAKYGQEVLRTPRRFSPVFFGKVDPSFHCCSAHQQTWEVIDRQNEGRGDTMPPKAEERAIPPVLVQLAEDPFLTGPSEPRDLWWREQARRNGDTGRSLTGVQYPVARRVELPQKAPPVQDNRPPQSCQNAGQGNLERGTERPVAGLAPNSIPGAQSARPGQDNHPEPNHLIAGLGYLKTGTEYPVARQVPFSLPAAQRAPPVQDNRPAESCQNAGQGNLEAGTEYPVARQVPFSLPAAQRAPPVQDNRPAESYQNAGQGNLERDVELGTAKCLQCTRPLHRYGHPDPDSSKCCDGFGWQETNYSRSGPQNQDSQPATNYQNGAQGNAKKSYYGFGRQETNYPHSGPQNQDTQPARSYQNGAQGSTKKPFNGFGRQETNYSHSGPQNQDSQPARSYQNGAQGKKPYNGFGRQEANYSHSGPQNQDSQPARNNQNGAQGNVKKSYNGFGRQGIKYSHSGPQNQDSQPARNYQNGAQGNAKVPENRRSSQNFHGQKQPGGEKKPKPQHEVDSGLHTGHTHTRKNLWEIHGLEEPNL